MCLTSAHSTFPLYLSISRKQILNTETDQTPYNSETVSRKKVTKSFTFKANTLQQYLTLEK